MDTSWPAWRNRTITGRKTTGWADAVISNQILIRGRRGQAKPRLRRGAPRWPSGLRSTLALTQPCRSDAHRGRHPVLSAAARFRALHRQRLHGDRYRGAGRHPRCQYADRVPDAVIFDLDGVLLDSEQLWNQAKEEVVRESGGRWHDEAPRA